MAYDSARFDHAPERARSSSRRGSEVVKDEAYRRTPELSRSLFRKRAREVRQTDDSSLTRLVPVHEAGRNVSDRNDCPNPGGPLVVLLEVGLLTYRHVRSKPSHPFDRAMALRIKKERTVANQLGSHADDSGRTVPESHRSSLFEADHKGLACHRERVSDYEARDRDVKPSARTTAFVRTITVLQAADCVRTDSIHARFQF